MITLSEDGYVRLTLATLQKTPLVHLLSGLDEDEPGPLQPGAGTSEISGYTEWVSSTIPVITIGWDWRLVVVQGQHRCIRMSPPRSNLMLLDDQQCDLGQTQSAALLEIAIDALGWQDEIIKAINNRYTSTTWQV